MTRVKLLPDHLFTFQKGENDVWQWCYDNFGPTSAFVRVDGEGRLYNPVAKVFVRWGWSEGHVCFQNEEDAVLFKLTWF